MSSFKEMNELVNLSYSYKEILVPKGFRVVETEALKSGSGIVTKWLNDENDYDVFLITSDEDSPCIDFSDIAEKRELSKLDLIRTLHAGNDWKVLQQIVANGAPLSRGYLSDLGQLKREEESVAEAAVPYEERMAKSPVFSQMVLQERMRLEAAKIAREMMEEAEATAFLTNFLSKTPDEISKLLGEVDWVELWEKETVERWFVPNFICASRAHSFFARSGLGKSLVCQEIAVCAASGKSVLGHPPQAPIRVLYVDNENLPEGDLKPRFQSMGFGPEDLENLKYLSFPDIGPLNKEIGSRVFIQVLEMYQPDLVFLDTFSRFLDGDENLSKTAQEFYNHTGKELKKRGIAYVRIDHIGKKNEDTARGTSAKMDDVDLIWQMKEIDTDAKFEIINEKARVQIAEERFILTRSKEPLSHRVLSGIDWVTLIKIAERAEMANGLIQEYAESGPNPKMGKTSVWDALKSRCKPLGITRDELWNSLYRYQNGEEGVLEDEIHVHS